MTERKHSKWHQREREGGGGFASFCSVHPLPPKYLLIRLVTVEPREAR